jgi:hypothetical protein
MLYLRLYLSKGFALMQDLNALASLKSLLRKKCLFFRFLKFVQQENPPETLCKNGYIKSIF